MPRRSTRTLHASRRRHSWENPELRLDRLSESDRLALFLNEVRHLAGVSISGYGTDEMPRVTIERTVGEYGDVSTVADKWQNPGGFIVGWSVTAESGAEI